MRLKPKLAVPTVEMDMTPMIDMTFQLIAFFMVLLNFAESEQDARIKLPSSQLAKPPEVAFESPLVLQLTADDQVIFGGELMPISDLAKPLRAEKRYLEVKGEKPEDKTVILRADGNARTGVVQEVMQQCQENGFENFALREAGASGGRAMKLRHMANKLGDRVDIQMTPMIDIVFLLLIFFVFNFRIIVQEGDFNIRMPVAGPAMSTDLDTQLPIKVRLTSDTDGNLTGIEMGDQKLPNFAALHEQIMARVGGDAGPEASDKLEAELDCDYNLKYRFVIAAVTAVSGYVTPDGHIVKLIQKIKLSPPKKPA